MTEEPTRGTPPDEDLIQVDGRTVRFQVWEQELMLRAVAWVTIIQGVAMTGVAGSRWMRWRLILDAWPLAGMAALVGLAFLCVRSREAKAILLVEGAAGCLFLFLGGAFASGSSYAWRVERFLPVLLGAVHGGSGLLLLRRRALARDVLLILTGAWLVVLGPPVLEELSEVTSFSGRFTRRHLAPLAAWLLPPAFVFLTLITRAGRSLFTDGATSGKLAPFASLRQGPPTARGWASLLVVLLTLFGSALTLETLEDLVRDVW